MFHYCGLSNEFFRVTPTDQKLLSDHNLLSSDLLEAVKSQQFSNIEGIIADISKLLVCI